MNWPRQGCRSGVWTLLAACLLQARKSGSIKVRVSQADCIFRSRLAVVAPCTSLMAVFSLPSSRLDMWIYDSFLVNVMWTICHQQTPECGKPGGVWVEFCVFLPLLDISKVMYTRFCLQKVGTKRSLMKPLLSSASSMQNHESKHDNHLYMPFPYM